jgi:peptidoglycan-N-acetylglucosamine deacetylase
MKFSLALLFSILIFSVSAQQIALTFDDAPTPDGPLYTGVERTDRIIKQLKDAKVVQVAFFVITSQIRPGTEARLQKYSEAGHLLANHTHTHSWIHRIGTAEYIQSIRTADSLLRKYDSFVPWFRYPFLDEGKTTSARDSIRAALSALDLSNGYVTIDNYDWYLNTLYQRALTSGKKVNEEMLKKIYLDHIWNSIMFYDAVAVKTLGRSPKHVLLLHENDLTAKFIKDLVELLRGKGWEIISPADAYTDPISKQIPDVLFNGQGRVGAIARAKGVPAKELVQASEDEAYLDDLVKTMKVFY